MKRIYTTTIAVIFQLVFCCAYCQPHNFEIKPGGPVQDNGTHKSPSAGYYYTEIDEENGTLTLYIPSLMGFVDVEISEEYKKFKRVRKSEWRKTKYYSTAMLLQRLEK